MWNGRKCTVIAFCLKETGSLLLLVCWSEV